MAPCLPFTRARPRFGAATPSENGHNEVVIALLQAGASVDERDLTQATALMAAAEGGHVDALTALLDGAVRRRKDAAACRETLPLGPWSHCVSAPPHSHPPTGMQQRPRK